MELDCFLSRHNHYWSSDHKGVPSIKLLMLCTAIKHISHDIELLHLYDIHTYVNGEHTFSYLHISLEMHDVTVRLLSDTDQFRQ